MLPRNEMEKCVVDAVLRELRVAMKEKAAVTLTLDPFFDGSGGYVIASSDSKARRYEFIKRRART